MRAVFWSKVVLKEDVPLIVFLTTRGRPRTSYLPLLPKSQRPIIMSKYKAKATSVYICLWMGLGDVRMMRESSCSNYLTKSCVHFVVINVIS